MTQAQDQNQERGQGIDGATLLEEIIARSNLPEYKQVTTYTPFEGSDDNQVSLSPGMVLRFFAKPTRNGNICTYEQAVRFVMLCKARRLDPREGDAFIVGYDGKNGPEFNLITAHQAFAKRADAHEAYQGMESGVTVIHSETEEIRDIEGDYVPQDCTLVGGWARVHRSDRKHPFYRRLDVKAFQKNTSIWDQNRAGMIVKCAEADAYRSAFPNLTAGMYMAEEIQPSDSAPNDDARNAPQPSRSYKLAKAAEQQSNVKQAAADTGHAAGTGDASTVSDSQPKGTPATGAGATSPTNPSFSPTKAGGGTPTSAPASGRPKAKTVVEKCPDCGYALANGKCPACASMPSGPMAAAEVDGGRSSGEATASGRESTSAPSVAEPVDPPAPDEAEAASDEEKAEMSAARPIEVIRKEFAARAIMGPRVKAIVAKAYQIAGIVGLDVATEPQLRHAERVFILRKLQA